MANRAFAQLMVGLQFFLISLWFFCGVSMGFPASDLKKSEAKPGRPPWWWRSLCKGRSLGALVRVGRSPGRENWRITIWLWLTVCHGKSQFLIGKPSINGSFSMAMLNNQMVYIYTIGKYYWKILLVNTTGKYYWKLLYYWYWYY